jgi:hypothetical protein
MTLACIARRRFRGVSLTRLQNFKLLIAILSECIGYLFILWSAYLQYLQAQNTADMPNIFGIWLSLMFGFLFLVAGILSVRSIKKQIPENLVYWLTNPALIVCIALLGFYLWLALPYPYLN